jgi:hypothetical protein
MQRSVRNGLAIAGMAGGMLFLGQAVASADDGGGGADANNAVGTTAAAEGTGSGGGETEAENETTNANVAADVDVNKVSAADINAGNVVHVYSTSGDNSAPDESNNADAALVEPEPNGAPSEVVFDTGNKTEIEARSGSVSGSNSPVVGNGARGGATANNELDADANASGSGRGDTEADNETTNVNAAVDADVNKVETGPINTGNVVEVINNSGGNTAYCEAGGCTIYFNTGNETYITVTSGDVSNSNNPWVGNSGLPPGAKPGQRADDCPDKAPPAKKAAAAPAPRKAVSSAQPKGELAYTGADSSLPLTLGLLALGAGGALTLAGRRRDTATV